MSTDIPNALRDLEEETKTFNQLIQELRGIEGEDDPETAREVVAEFEATVFENAAEGLAAVPAWKALKLAQLAQAKSLEAHFSGLRKGIEEDLKTSDRVVHRVLLAVADAESDADLVDGQASNRRVRSDRVNVGLRKIGIRKVVTTCPAELLPRAYQRRKVEPDAKALRKALERGEEIAGVELAPHAYSVHWGKV